MRDEIKLTAEQQQAVLKLVRGLNSKESQQTLGGYAGTGKSYLISYLIRKLKNSSVCAYTGKAANVLRKKGVEDASTIHSLIYEPKVYGGQVHFELKDRDDLACDQIIVDESSMVSKELYSDLRSFQKPIIFVGDHGQLEPIGSEFNLMDKPDITLDRIHRNSGEIAFFAEWLRKSMAAQAFQVQTGEVQFLDKWAVKKPGFVNLVCEVDQVICAFNKTRIDINARARAALGHEGMVCVGEKIMCLRNNRKLGLFNGMQGIVLDYWIEGKAHFIDFESNDKTITGIRIHPDQFGQERTLEGLDRDGPMPFDYAYCITAHKCIDPSTLVEVAEGLMPISEIPAFGKIATASGVFPYENIVENPVGPNMTFTTRDGYQITVTPDHRMEVWDGDRYSMIEARSVVLGATMRLKLGSSVEGKPQNLPPSIPGRAVICPIPTVVNEEFAEFLGLFVAGGTVFQSGFRLAKGHPEVVARFSELAFRIFGINGTPTSMHGAEAVEFNSTILARWLESIGGLVPNKKDVPNCVLKGSLRIHERFLRGLLEDGFANLRNKNTLDHVGWYTKHPVMMQKVKTMLLRMGIISGSLRGKEGSHLYLYGRNAIKFREKIGFISKSKQSRLSSSEDTQRFYTVPISRAELEGMRKHSGKRWNVFAHQNSLARGTMSRDMAESLVRELESGELRDVLTRRLEFHHSRVTRIEHGQGPSMCVTVPGEGRFLQNGFSHGNSQGDEWNKVLVIEQICKNWEHRRWAYTAASRAKQKLYWSTT